jgi:hypothetical protein
VKAVRKSLESTEGSLFENNLSIGIRNEQNRHTYR